MMAQTADTIRMYYDSAREFGSYVADPHTAVGLNVANRIAETKYVVFAVAYRSPALTSAPQRPQRRSNRPRDCPPRQIQRRCLGRPVRASDVRLPARHHAGRV